MSRYKLRNRTNFRLIRTVIGIIAAFIILFSAIIASYKLPPGSFAALAMSFSSLFAVGSWFFTLVGSIIGYWKRSFGGFVMIIGAVFGIGVIPIGGIANLGLLMLAFCIVSSYWHILPD